MHYMVFGSIKRPLVGGGSYLDWALVHNPLGVYQGDTPDDACRAAAADTNNMGTFFAIEGTPWGIEMMAGGSTQFGRKESALERLERRLAYTDEVIAKLERGDSAQS